MVNIKFLLILLCIVVMSNTAYADETNKVNKLNREKLILFIKDQSELFYKYIYKLNLKYESGFMFKNCQFTDTMDYPLKLHFEVDEINFGKVQKWPLAILNDDLFSNPTGIDYFYSNKSKINIPLE